MIAADVAAVILAGGRATRLGGAVKPLLQIGDATIVARLEAACAPLVGEVLVSTAAPAAWTSRRQVHDRVADAGPLAGLDAAFAATDTTWLLVLAGDLPDVQPALLVALLAATAADVDAVVPRLAGHPEPLLAVYHRRCAAVVCALLDAGRRRVAGLAEHPAVRTRWLDEAALRQADPELRSFAGINDPADLARATAISLGPRRPVV